MVPASLAVWEGKVTQQILGGGKAGERTWDKVAQMSPQYPPPQSCGLCEEEEAAMGMERLPRGVGLQNQEHICRNLRQQRDPSAAGALGPTSC